MTKEEFEDLYNNASLTIRRPKRIRLRTTPKEVEEKIIEVRKKHMSWGKTNKKAFSTVS